MVNFKYAFFQCLKYYKSIFCILPKDLWMLRVRKNQRSKFSGCGSSAFDSLSLTKSKIVNHSSFTWESNPNSCFVNSRVLTKTFITLNGSAMWQVERPTACREDYSKIVNSSWHCCISVQYFREWNKKKKAAASPLHGSLGWLHA